MPSSRAFFRQVSHQCPVKVNGGAAGLTAVSTELHEAAEDAPGTCKGGGGYAGGGG